MLRNSARISRRQVRGLFFVHMATEAEARGFFERFDMDDVERISDPDGCLYVAFGLERAGLMQMLGPSVWKRGITAILEAILPEFPVGTCFGCRARSL